MRGVYLIQLLSFQVGHGYTIIDRVRDGVMNKRKVVAEVSVVPIGTGSASISEYVASCIDVVAKKKGISYRLNPMGTILEGDLEEILDAVREMHNVPFERGAQRVVTTLKIDDRCDKLLTMRGKLESVQKIKPKVKI